MSVTCATAHLSVPPARLVARVNPVYINKVEQIHTLDWDRRRRFQSTPIGSSCAARARLAGRAVPHGARLEIRKHSRVDFESGRPFLAQYPPRP